MHHIFQGGSAFYLEAQQLVAKPQKLEESKDKEIAKFLAKPLEQYFFSKPKQYLIQNHVDTKYLQDFKPCVCLYYSLLY